MIPQITDPAVYQQNMAAIDQLVRGTKYMYILAWGKWLGFTPETVRQHVELAAAENAPTDVIQKIDARWLRRTDVQNESNRRAVEELARVTQPLH